MFCTKCGTKITDGNKFCVNCGNPLNSQRQLVKESRSIQDVDFYPLINFVKQQKIKLLISTVILGGLYLGYYFFLKPNPEKLAKEVAQLSCNCYKNYDEAILKIETDFNNNFKTDKYKSRRDAEKEEGDLSDAEIIKLDNCLQEAIEKQKEGRVKFTQSKELMVFDKELDSALTKCNREKQTTILKIKEEIITKIQTIKDPEPDTEKLKADLIGKELPGWKFEFISEIQSLTITNKIRNGNYIELVADITTKTSDGKQTNNYNNVTISYLLNDEGSWYLQNLSCTNFVYNIIVEHVWKKVSIPSGVSYSINTHDRKGLVKEDSWNPTNYKLGPDGDRLNLHSNVIYLASREGNVEILISLNFTKTN